MINRHRPFYFYQLISHGKFFFNVFGNQANGFQPGIIVFIYRDPVFILGQGFGVFVYARNLYFELRDRRKAASA